MFESSEKKFDPEAIFLDSENLPSFSVERFEGRLERALSKKSIFWLGVFFLILSLALFFRAGFLQVARGNYYALRSEANHLEETIIFADRGLIFDRNGKKLAWNNIDGSREYLSLPGLAHVLGYLGFSSGGGEEIFAEEKIGQGGLEKLFNEELRGVHGVRIEEIDVYGQAVSNGVREAPRAGEPITSSIDASLQVELHRLIKEIAGERGFRGGAGIILDLENGEVLALTNYPEFEPNVLSKGKDTAAIEDFLDDPKTPFLNRATEGLYTPGSSVKPFIAVGALDEKIIDPEKEILSTGSISVPNHYDPEKPSVFVDWKPLGLVDIRRALALSSNIYFYSVGGGYKDQAGIGISGIEKYLRLFGFGTSTALFSASEPDGVIPSPRWKKENFPNEPWRIGDTYNTAIGQYGFQVTPLQMVRAIAAVATGKLVTPKLLKVEPSNGRFNLPVIIPVAEESRKIVREGMRMAVTEGTAQTLYFPGVSVAAKSGTAELDAGKRYVNSWVSGFFPTEKPKYAFTVVMERGPRVNIIGAGVVMGRLLEWMQIYTPEYFD